MYWHVNVTFELVACCFLSINTIRSIQSVNCVISGKSQEIQHLKNRGHFWFVHIIYDSYIQHISVYINMTNIVCVSNLFSFAKRFSLFIQENEKSSLILRFPCIFWIQQNNFINNWFRCIANLENHFNHFIHMPHHILPPNFFL